MPFAALRTSLLGGLLLLGGTACWNRVERQMEERVATMENHLVAAFDGIEAVKKDDGVAFERAMKALEQAGEAPGTLEDGALREVHQTAARLRKTSDRRERAEGLVGLSMQCAACHARNGVSLKTGFTYDTPAQELYSALVWVDDMRWNEAAVKAERPALSEAEGWKARREAFVDALLD